MVAGDSWKPLPFKKFTNVTRFFTPPENGECEGPEDQRLPQFKLFPLLHDMAAAKDAGGIEGGEKEGLHPK